MIHADCSKKIKFNIRVILCSSLSVLNEWELFRTEYPQKNTGGVTIGKQFPLDSAKKSVWKCLFKKYYQSAIILLQIYISA